jgi:hypothetical protein
MQKIFLYLATCVWMMLTTHKANAYDFSAVNNGQTIYYNITSSTAPLTVEVTYEQQDAGNYSGSIDIPDNVTYNSNTYTVTAIGDYAFAYCNGLTGSLTFSNSIITIGDYAFAYCSELTGTLTLSNSVTVIGDYAFSYCSGLTSVTIPNSVTTIGDWAFSDCSGLTGSLTIPNSVITIGEFAFFYCSGLTGPLTLPNSITSIGISAFSHCSGLTSIIIPNSVITIGEGSFSYCSGLTSIIVGAGNPNYSSLDGVLFNKLQSTLIQYPAGKTGSYTIPNTVTSIGDGAFAGCTGLTSVTLLNSVISIGSSAFAYCSGLTSIDVNVDNPNYSSLGGVLFNKLQDTLIQCPAGKTGNYTIPNSVTTIGEVAFAGCGGLTAVTLLNSVITIGEAAFAGCSRLTAVTLPNSVITIGDYAFSYCSGLTAVTLPNSVTTIGIFTFAFCSGLISVTIPNSVTTIGVWAFSDCSGLTSITIPNSVTTIGSKAFFNCSGLTEVHVKVENPPVLGSDVFYNVSDTIPVYVLCGKEAVYKSTKGWDYFTNITEDCTGIEELAIENQHTIYPNPATDNIHISLPENVHNAFFTLYDMQGKELIKQEVSNQETVLLNNLAAGIYIYHIKTNKENQTGKLRINSK